MMTSLMAILGMDISRFEYGARRAEDVAKELGAKVKESVSEMALGAFAGFSLGNFVESTVEAATQIKQLSELFHVSTDTIQIWQRAAARVGMTAEEVGNAMNRLKKAREEAISEGPTATKFRDLFGAFGVGLEDLKNGAVSVESIMNRMRAAAEGHPLTDQEDVAAIELMGKGGAKVLSVMEQINNLGPIHLMQKEDIDNIHEAELRLQNFKRELAIGFSMMAGQATPIADRLGALLYSAFTTGGMNWNQTKEAIKDTAISIPAPTVDLKGRPIPQKGEKPGETAEGNYYNIVKVVDLQKDAKEIERLRNELAEKALANQMRTMSAAERTAEIKRQIAEHERKAIEFEFGEGDDVKALKEKLEIEKLRSQIPKESFHFRPPEVTEHERIGAFAGSPMSTIKTTLDKSEKHLAEIKAHLAGVHGESKKQTRISEHTIYH